MEKNSKLKLFISYSHQDNEEKPFIDEFKSHISPLKDNGLIEDWYDREIFPGENFEIKIDNNLEDADIVCLFLSANFLSSEYCMKEKVKALELRKKKEISIIPIVLTNCGWKDDQDISKLLALPEDGKAVSSFQDRNEAWHDTYNGLKRIIGKEIKIRHIKIDEKFGKFLQDTEIFKKAHSQKERVYLDDIVIYPELDKYNSFREKKGTVSSQELLKNLLDYPKIVIAGEDQSGKTTLCKLIFMELIKKNFIPVYICSKKNPFKQDVEKTISRSFYQEYDGINIKEIDNERIIPIIDDFHFEKKKEKYIKALSKYPRCIITVDEVFSINIKDENIISSFAHFELKELKPTLRNELIEKWANLTDKQIDNYKNIDKRTEMIEHTIGRTIGRGIMPAYPFYILSVIFTTETSTMPLNQEITSQGYCYQAFITFYLSKQGVTNDEIDIYMNFLKELAFYVYKEKKPELSIDDFKSFMKFYLEKYNLPIEPNILLENLNQIVSADSLNNFSFKYNYLYYFFVAEYLAEHIEDEDIKQEINHIMKNLHVNENAYIAVFIAHHSRNTKILNEIKNSALSLFDEFEPATLTKDEVKFFDEQVDNIIEASLPPSHITPEKERKKRLKIQDKLEESEKDGDHDLEEIKEEESNSLEIDLRRAIKTVEVMGCIIKNRAGSLEKTELEYVFKEAMDVHLRVLSSFFELIKRKEQQNYVIDFLSERLRKIVKESEEIDGEISEERLRKDAEIIFWNLNFFVVNGVISKIVHSLGSDKLTLIMDNVCDEVNTPASFMVKHGILMWYTKNLQLNELAKRIWKNDFSELARRSMQLMVVDHCCVHQIDFRDRQRISSKLKIRNQRLLTDSHKGLE